jgi:4-hydroxy-tetrahydrodipicolinate synthase
MIELIRAADRNDLQSAREWHRKLYALCRDMLGLATNPIPIKAAMKMLGRDTGEMRLPMTPLEPQQETALRKTLVAYGLL